MEQKWVKGCNCKSTSSTGKIRDVFTTNGRLTDIDFIFYPQPSCDACGEPWKLVESDNEDE